MLSLGDMRMRSVSASSLARLMCAFRCFAGSITPDKMCNASSGYRCESIVSVETSVAYSCDASKCDVTTTADIGPARSDAQYTAGSSKLKRTDPSMRSPNFATAQGLRLQSRCKR